MFGGYLLLAVRSMALPSWMQRPPSVFVLAAARLFALLHAALPVAGLA